MFYEKFEAYLPKILLKKLPKIEANFTNLEVWCSKTELPKIEITNIEGYQYRGIPVFEHLRILSFQACLLYTSPSPRDKRQSRMPSSA